jgi:hypothetical protein
MILAVAMPLSPTSNLERSGPPEIFPYLSIAGSDRARLALRRNHSQRIHFHPVYTTYLFYFSFNMCFFTLLYPPNALSSPISSLYDAC